MIFKTMLLFFNKISSITLFSETFSEVLRKIVSKLYLVLQIVSIGYIIVGVLIIIIFIRERHKHHHHHHHS